MSHSMSSLTEWEEALRDILHNECDFSNMSSILVYLFEGVVVPDLLEGVVVPGIFLTHANKVAVQKIFSVRVSAAFF